MKIVLATKNQGKVDELKSILDGLNVEVVGAKEAGFNQEIEEDQKTLEANSMKKARIVSNYLGLPAVADDTGLFIKALNGNPGIYSKRWAGEKATDEDRIQYTLSQLSGIEDREAHFETVASFSLPDGRAQIFRGLIRGSIATEPKGNLRPGMPYDLLFIPEGTKFTFAEMSVEHKNNLSHRAKAFKQLRDYLENILRRP